MYRWHTPCTQPGDVVAALDTASPDLLRDARKLVIVSRPHQAARSTGNLFADSLGEDAIELSGSV
jgi:hypothetical protein